RVGQDQSFRCLFREIISQKTYRSWCCYIAFRPSVPSLENQGGSESPGNAGSRGTTLSDTGKLFRPFHARHLGSSRYRTERPVRSSSLPSHARSLAHTLGQPDASSPSHHSTPS